MEENWKNVTFFSIVNKIKIRNSIERIFFLFHVIVIKFKRGKKKISFHFRRLITNDDGTFFLPFLSISFQKTFNSS